jgi:DNA-binding LytR/AlgR family response regulator
MGGLTFNPFMPVLPPDSDKVLEGFCPEPHPEERIAINSNGLMLFVRLADIEWLEVSDQGVVLHIGREMHVLHEPLTTLVAKLPPGRFRRLGPRALVNVEHIRDLQPLRHRRCTVVLHSGTRLIFLRG